MRLVRAARDLRPPAGGVCLAIGMFDGVHLGHQQVIRRTLADARAGGAAAVVLTFDRHPNHIVAPQRVPPLVYSLPQKLRAIAALGVEASLLIAFDEPFSRQSGEQFIRGLVHDLGRIQSICVGNAFGFGHRRSGNLELIEHLGAELGFAARGLPAVALDQRMISSTRIREAIQKGDLAGAGEMLGRPYALAGLVVPGDRLGRKLGFPTANLDTPGLVLPPHGIYVVEAAIAGRTHHAVLSLGLRPTIEQPQPQLRVETHLLDFEGDLYGQELELTFVKRLRGEEKFPTLEALRGQIAEDVRAACEVFQKLDVKINS